MFRMLAAVAVVLGLSASAFAQKSAGLQIDYGKVTGIDAAKGKLAVRIMPKNGDPFDKDFTIAETVKLYLVANGERTELTGKDRLKNEKLKEGVVVRAYSDADGKLSFVEFTVPN